MQEWELHLVRLGQGSVRGRWGAGNVVINIGVLEKVRNVLIHKKYGVFRTNFSLGSRFYYFIFLNKVSFCNNLNNAANFLCHINGILVGGIFLKIEDFNPSAFLLPSIFLSIYGTVISLISLAIILCFKKFCLNNLKIILQFIKFAIFYSLKNWLQNFFKLSSKVKSMKQIIFEKLTIFHLVGIFPRIEGDQYVNYSVL